MQKHAPIPIDVVHLLPVLDEKLLELLHSLSPAEWEAQTIARLWKVKDVAAHLLDSNVRILSVFRDGYTGETADIRSYEELLQFLNGLNADWVKAMKRMSPQLLILMHEVTGPLFCNYFKTLDPFGISPFPVAWAGEDESRNWMEIAREYTEKWLHQQQVRDAVNKPGLMTKELFYPFIDIFMMALPHTYRNIDAAEGTTVQMIITGDIGGTWHVAKSNNTWQLHKNAAINSTSSIAIDPDTAWKLFSKSLRPANVMHKIKITGNETLALTALEMVSVMA